MGAKKKVGKEKGGGCGTVVDFYTSHDRCCDVEAAPRRSRAWGWRRALADDTDVEGDCACEVDDEHM